jgi:hypothetical protein
MARIFVSYRREDAAGFAGRLKDELKRRFGDVEVFRDVDDIASGEDFVERLDRALRDCRVLIAVIGQNWLAKKNAQGIARLHDADDFVRREISSALLGDVLVIPVLVNGARMPDEVDLPDDLKALARRQAHELADSRWDYDIGRLGDRIEETLGPAATVPPDLTGTWDFPNGSYWTVDQSGRDVTIHEVHYDSREIWKEGTGTIEGNSLTFKLDLVFQGGHYTEGELRLSQDARQLTGVAVTHPRGSRDRVVLVRR